MFDFLLNEEEKALQNEVREFVKNELRLVVHLLRWLERKISWDCVLRRTMEAEALTG